MRVEINTVDGDRYTIASMDDGNVAQLVDAFHAGDPVLTVVLDGVKRKKKPREVVTHIRRDAIVSLEVLAEL